MNTLPLQTEYARLNWFMQDLRLQESCEWVDVSTQLPASDGSKISRLVEVETEKSIVCAYLDFTDNTWYSNWPISKIKPLRWRYYQQN